MPNMPLFGFASGNPAFVSGQSLVPVAPIISSINPSGIVSSSLFASQSKPTIATGNIPVANDNLTKNSLGIKGFSLYNPDYSDPHGIKTYVDVTKDFIHQERKALGEIVDIETPYDNDDLLRRNLSVTGSGLRYEDRKSVV